MKKTILLSALFFLSFTTDQKTATLKFSEADYNAWKTNVIDAVNKIDSVKIALSVSGGNEKINKMLEQARGNGGGNQLIQ